MSRKTSETLIVAWNWNTHKLWSVICNNICCSVPLMCTKHIPQLLMWPCAWRMSHHAHRVQHCVKKYTELLTNLAKGLLFCIAVTIYLSKINVYSRKGLERSLICPCYCKETVQDGSRDTFLLPNNTGQLPSASSNARWPTDHQLSSPKGRSSATKENWLKQKENLLG